MQKRIWEINAVFRCQLIGFGLSMAEQKQIVKKVYRKIKRFSDFEIHEILVNGITDDSPLSKRVESFLNRKYGTEITEWGDCTSEEWRNIFNSHYEHDNLGALIWISAAYILLSEEEACEIFGKIHILSHNQFQQHRCLLTNLSCAEKRTSDLQEKYFAVRKQLDEERGERRKLQAENKIQEQKLGDLWAENERFKKAGDFQHKKTNESLLGQIRKLEQFLESRNDSIERLKAERNRLNQNLSGQNRLFENMQLEFEKILTIFKPDESQCSKCEQHDLCDRKVLIVGGISKLRTFYQQLVIKMGGLFEYHDGYLDNGDKVLTNQIGRSDIVICPVDINSHAACMQVKKNCKKLSKPYFMLRNSSVSTVYKTLQKLAQ